MLWTRRIMQAVIRIIGEEAYNRQIETNTSPQEPHPCRKKKLLAAINHRKDQWLWYISSSDIVYASPRPQKWPLPSQHSSISTHAYTGKTGFSMQNKNKNNSLKQWTWIWKLAVEYILLLSVCCHVKHPTAQRTQQLKEPDAENRM